MARLGIDLQDGFDGAEVIVCVDGREVLRTAAAARRVLGLAERTAVDVADGPVAVDVQVPSRGIDQRIDVDASTDAYVGLSLGRDRVNAIVSRKPFGYG